MNDKLLIGFSEISLTPDRRVSLSGQFAPRISDSVETPVTATAMAVTTGGDQFVLCSCDLVAVSTALQAEVRRQLLNTVDDLDVDKVILSATHTHTSLLYHREAAVSSLAVLRRYLPHPPEAAPVPDDVMNPQEAFDFLAERIATAVRTAWQTRRPASVGFGFGRAVVGLCRRAVFNDGSAEMWGDTNQAVFDHLEGGNDSGIELMYVYDEKQRPVGIVANIACPAQCVQHRHFISSDYWGEVKARLRGRLGAHLPVVGLCGAAGDQCPVDLVRWVEPEMPLDDPNIKHPHPIRRRADPSMFDLAGKRTVGRRIADEIIAVQEAAAANRSDDLELTHRVLTLDLPVRRVTPSEYREARQALENYLREQNKSGDFNDDARMHVHAGTIARYEYQFDHDLHPVETHVIRFGDIVIATNPFELFLDYGNQMRARSLAAQTFIVQLACGCEGYLPTARAERGGHYSAYVSSGITGHAGGDLLVRHTLSAINALFPFTRA
jgi:hypothetical protein